MTKIRSFLYLVIFQKKEHSEGESSGEKSDYMEEDEENDQNSHFWDVSDELRQTDMVIGNNEVVDSSQENKPG